MSVGTKLLQAAAGNAGSDPVYVDDVFSTHLYDGESSTSTTITINNGLDLSDKGGLLWTKSRGGAYPHYLIDSERGHGTGAILYSNLTNAATNSSFSTAFTSTGYTMKGGYDGFSQSSTSYGSPYVSWAFAKQEKFFDIVTYTGNGTAGRTISHNLGSVPGMIIVKRTDTTQDWVVYHRSLSANTKSLFLNSTSAELSYSWLNSTDPTSTVVTLGDRADVNASGGTYVMYLFAHNEQEFGEDSDEAIIHCGSYTGTGSFSSPPVINLGFEPQWVMLKNSTSSGDWVICDVMRGATSQIIGTAGNAERLNANNSNADTSYSGGYIPVSPTATGFTMSIDGSEGNASGKTYIYMAIRRPHKPASEFAATDLWTTDTRGSVNSSEPGFRSTFPVDMAFWDTGVTTANAATRIVDRLRGPQYSLAHNTGSESGGSTVLFDYNNGWLAETGTTTNIRSWMWRRAPGFFDMVTYEGTGSARTIAHNLGAVPELMIAKSRTESQPWVTYDAANGATKYARLESQNAVATYSGIWNDTAPTSSVFSTGGDAYINKSGHSYIIYLFATVTGISKVGSYTGTGNNLNVDCGFSGGARFILIKRTNDSGDWYLYDSARGIVAGNDPYLLLNSNAASVTNTDYIDPLSSGFTVTSSAPAALNTSGGTYLFYAIA
tara:strand:- start:1060 stop:3045 length:1986 start_codon:yes stop_codon:yes gene_type:complete